MRFVKRASRVLILTMLTATGLLNGTLVKNGQPAATIVIRDTAFQAAPYQPSRGAAGSPDGKVKLAALDLQAYVEKLSGAKLPIVSDAQEVTGAVVLVGPSQRTEAIKGVKIPAGRAAE